MSKLGRRQHQSRRPCTLRRNTADHDQPKRVAIAMHDIRARCAGPFVLSQREPHVRVLDFHVNVLKSAVRAVNDGSSRRVFAALQFAANRFFNHIERAISSRMSKVNAAA